VRERVLAGFKSVDVKRKFFDEYHSVPQG